MDQVSDRRLHRFKRWMYRSGRPNWLARSMNRVSAWQFSAGFLAPGNWVTLEVAGRRSGRTVSFPVVASTTTAGGTWCRCSASGRTGYATYGPPPGGRCCDTATADRCCWWRSRSSGGHRSCATIWRRLRARDRTCRSTGGRRSRSSRESPPNTRCSGYCPERKRDQARREFWASRQANRNLFQKLRAARGSGADRTSTGTVCCDGEAERTSRFPAGAASANACAHERRHGPRR